MTRNSFLKKLPLICFGTLGIMIISIMGATQNTISAQSSNDTTSDPAWLEPRALSVVDLLSGGINPSWLVGTTVSWTPGFSHLELTSASVSGTDITINGSVTPTITQGFNCVGNLPYHDQWPVSVPASLLTVKANNVDVTDKVIEIRYIPAGKYLPDSGSKEGNLRYPMTIDSTPSFSGGKMEVPANMGCMIFLNGDYSNITVTYEFDVPKYISIEVVGGKTKELASFYWPNPNLNVSSLKSLNQQMYQRYSEFGRHDRTGLDLPSDADYVLPIFSSVSIDPYSSKPDLAKGGGTYRIREQGAPTNLSVDHITLTGLPINGQTIDQDYNASATYLPFYETNNNYELMALEVIVLNQPYNTCMTNGGCSTSLLDTINNDRMAIDIHYLKVTRILNGLTQIPLRQTGPNWSPGSRDMAATSGAISVPVSTVSDSPVISADINMTHEIYLPIIFRAIPIPEDNPTADCPCGWFTDDGRMLDFVSPP